jgi:hypothetical protein
LGINPTFASIAGLLIGVFSLGLLFLESGNKGESLEAERWFLKGQVSSVFGVLLGRESMNISAKIINIPANAMGYHIDKVEPEFDQLQRFGYSIYA